jgi:hypothetical protein
MILQATEKWEQIGSAGDALTNTTTANDDDGDDDENDDTNNNKKKNTGTATTVNATATPAVTTHIQSSPSGTIVR